MYSPTLSPIFRARDHYDVKTPAAQLPDGEAGSRMGPPPAPRRSLPPFAPTHSQWRGADLGAVVHHFTAPGYRRDETDFVVGTGQLYGLRGGFSRFAHAMQAAAAASAGDKPAVAVLQGQDGNFHLRGVRSFTVERLWGTPPAGQGGDVRLVSSRFRPYDLSAHLAGRGALAGESHSVSPGFNNGAADLRALVDGDAAQVAS